MMVVPLLNKAAAQPRCMALLEAGATILPLMGEGCTVIFMRGPCIVDQQIYFPELPVLPSSAKQTGSRYLFSFYPFLIIQWLYHGQMPSGEEDRTAATVRSGDPFP